MAGLAEADLRAIAARYELAPLVRTAPLAVKGSSRGYYLLETTSRRYFLKAYKWFGPDVARGLDLLLFLADRGYPAARVLRTREGGASCTWDGTHLALFEYVDIPEETALSPEQARAMGAALGRLHVLARDYAMPSGGVDVSWLERRLRDFRQSVVGSALAEGVLDYAERALPHLDIPSDLPQSVCHQEFLRQHVRFMDEQIVAVIDWDLAGRDHMFRDLSCAMKESMRGGAVDFALLGPFVSGYETERPLTGWERAHLYEGLCFAALKYVAWALESRNPSVPLEEGSAALPLRRVDSLRRLGKDAFDTALAAARGR